MVMSQKFFRHMGADNAHKADDTEERYAGRSNKGGQQERNKAEPVHIDAHGLGGSFTAKEGVVFPGHQ